MKQFANQYDATEYMKELVGSTSFPELSDHMVEMVVESCKTIDSESRLISNPEYQYTIDVYKCAAELYVMKSGLAVNSYDFKSDNQSFSRSQILNHLERMVQFYKNKQFSSFNQSNTNADILERFRNCGCRDED